MIYHWKLAFKNPGFKKRLLVTIVTLLVVTSAFAWLLNYIELRQGHVWYDPVLDFVYPRDVSDFIFIVTYSAALIILLYALMSPYRFLHLAQMYCLLTILRFFAILFVPLEPPATIIPLRDKFLTSTFYHGNDYLKDLFFSGHAATLFLFFFFTNNRLLRYFFLLAAIVVSVGVVVQHVHYSYDVIAAPLFAYLAYRLVSRHSKLYNPACQKFEEIPGQSKLNC